MTDEEVEEFSFYMNKLLDDYRGGPPRYIGDDWPKPKKEINYEEHATLSELQQYKPKEEKRRECAPGGRVMVGGTGIVAHLCADLLRLIFVNLKNMLERL
jgi:hypothetical protein